MIKKICYIFYYAVIMHLPHSRYIKMMNKIRVFYVCNVLGIMKKSNSARFQNNVYIAGLGAVSIGKDCQINEYKTLLFIIQENKNRVLLDVLSEVQLWLITPCLERFNLLDS